MRGDRGGVVATRLWQLAYDDRRLPYEGLPRGHAGVTRGHVDVTRGHVDVTRGHGSPGEISALSRLYLGCISAVDLRVEEVCVIEVAAPAVPAKDDEPLAVCVEGVAPAQLRAVAAYVHLHVDSTLRSARREI